MIVPAAAGSTFKIENSGEGDHDGDELEDHKGRPGPGGAAPAVRRRRREGGQPVYGGCDRERIDDGTAQERDDGEREPEPEAEAVDPPPPPLNAAYDRS